MSNIAEIGKRCSGCRGCEQACAVDAIRFEADAEGFMQPVVDADKCIDCGKCLKVCPIHNVRVFDQEQKGYAARTSSREDIKTCSSGGLFYAFAKNIIENGGVVCGCAVGEDLMPVHRCATTLDEVQSMRGSKYVQSNMDGIFAQVKTYLQEGREVLFTGVPCQVAGLRNFLMKDYANLFCVDIICHGVPSRKLYAEYLKWFGQKHGGVVMNYEFRSKRKHQWSLTLHADVKKANGKMVQVEQMASLDPFYHNFLASTTYRESCYTCSYSQSKRPGDITLGDFWGVEQTHPELFDIEGVSCVLVNSSKGVLLWERMKRYLKSQEVKTADIINYNGNLRAASHRPEVRDRIYAIVGEKGFGSIPYDFSKKAQFIDTIKDMIPNEYRSGLKMLLKKVRGYPLTGLGTSN